MLLLSPSLVNFIKSIFFSTVSFSQVLEPNLTEPGRKEGLKLFFSYFKIIPQKSSLFTMLLQPSPSPSKVCSSTRDHVFHSSMKVKVKVTQSSPTLVTPWTIQSLEFSRPEYWSGQPFPSPGNLPKPGIKPRSPALQADSLPAESQEKPSIVP